MISQPGNTATRYDVDTVKRAAHGRWQTELLPAAGYPSEKLDGQGHDCPLCGEGTDRFSLAYPDDGGVFCRHCFDKQNGDGIAAVQRIKNCTFPEALEWTAKQLNIQPTSTNGSHEGNGSKKPVKTYASPAHAKAAWESILDRPCKKAWSYHDVEGNAVAGALRFDLGDGQKEFRPVSRSAEGWILKAPPKPRPLYCLPELKDAPRIYIAEGEKAADAFQSIELVATTAFGGSKGLHLTDWTPIAGREWIASRDHDKPGIEWLKSLAKIGAELNPPAIVKELQLPWTDPQPGDDFFDWVEARDAVDPEELTRTVEEHADKAPLAKAATPAEPGTTNRDSELPDVTLPGGSIRISDTAGRIGQLLAESNIVFRRGNAVMRLERHDDQPVLVPVKSSGFASDIELVANLKSFKSGKDVAPYPQDDICSKNTAELLLNSSALREKLPPIKVVSNCPVLTERDGKLVEVSTYDSVSGILAGGKPTENVSVDEANELLRKMLADFNFDSAGDFARAMIAAITPALVFGDLLGAHAPIDFGEADSSQAGKGFRNKITTAIYRSIPYAVTQRDKGSVGSVQETLDAAIVSGHPFPSFDNFRGRIDSPGLEAFKTEDIYMARVPYSSPVPIETKRFYPLMTSNKIEATEDLTNRLSCVRIKKHPDGYQYRKYPEGTILDHVRAHQPKYLGAVFAIVREWHRRGKPVLDHVEHDFRKWAGVAGYISREILGAGDLLQGHRAAQQRIASSGLTWLRDVALAVQKADQCGQWLRAHHMLNILAESGIDNELTAGIDTDEDWQKATRKLGTKLSRVLNGDTATIDSILVERRKVTDESYRQQSEYSFSPKPLNTPEVTPEVKPRNPEAPEGVEKFLHAGAHAHTHAESLEGVQGVRGHDVLLRGSDSLRGYPNEDWGSV